MPDTITWGCTTANPSFCVSKSQGSDATAEIGQCRNALGAVTNEQAYSRTVKSKVSGVLVGGTAPAAGSSATVFGNTGLVESVSIQEENTGYKMIDATITKSDGATQVALA